MAISRAGGTPDVAWASGARRTIEAGEDVPVLRREMAARGDGAGLADSLAR